MWKCCKPAFFYGQQKDVGRMISDFYKHSSREFIIVNTSFKSSLQYDIHLIKTKKEKLNKFFKSSLSDGPPLLSGSLRFSHLSSFCFLSLSMFV